MEISKANFAQQHIFNEGLKTFDNKGRQTALKEVRQQNERKNFLPITVSASMERAQQAQQMHQQPLPPVQQPRTGPGLMVKVKNLFSNFRN